MKQRYHSIIKPRSDGTYVGWVEEIPGTISRGRSLEECRRRLRESLELMLQTHRSEARMFVDDSCVQECVEVELTDVAGHEVGTQHHHHHQQHHQPHAR